MTKLISGGIRVDFDSCTNAVGTPDLAWTYDHFGPGKIAGPLYQVIALPVRQWRCILKLDYPCATVDTLHLSALRHTAMPRITRESLLQRLQEAHEIEARLRGLARRLEQVSPEAAKELRALVQPVSLSDRILEAIDRCQDVN